MSPQSYPSSGKSQSGESQKVYCILIGVDGAPKDSHLPPLKYCASDCQELAKVLKQVTSPEREYREVILHNDNGAELVHNGSDVYSPTVKVVKTKLSETAKSAKRGDTILVWIGSHGVLIEGKTHLCVADTTVDDMGEYHNTLPLDELVDILLVSQAKQIVLLIDACHSGGISFPGEKLKDSQNFFAILSCHATQSSHEEEPLGSCLFTYYVIQGLLGEASTNDRGEITAATLYEYVCEQIAWHLGTLEHETVTINQSCSSRGNNTFCQVKQQTPIHKASGHGIPVLARKSQCVKYPLRQALIANQGLDEFVAKWEHLGLFDVQVWDGKGDLLHEIKEKLQGDALKPRKTVMLYLRGFLTGSEMTLSDNCKLQLPQLKKILTEADKVQQILILDCVGASLEEVKDWVKQLGDPERQPGQALIALATAVNAPESSVKLLCDILTGFSQNCGVTAAYLIKKLREVLGGKVDLWLSGKRGIIEIIPDPKVQKAYQTTSFWRRLAKKSSQKQLTTDRLTYREGVTLELRDIYVPLGLLERKGQPKIEEIKESAQGSQFYSATESEYKIAQKYQGQEFFDKVLQGQDSKSQGQRIAIIGEPGSGKTTYLQKTSDAIFENSSQAIPIWISLADLQGRAIGDYLLQVWLKDVLQVETPSEELKEALCEQFRVGNVWLLLDGIDEIADRNPLNLVAENLKGWVEEARVVVTARVNVWEVGHHDLSNFDAYRTLPFEDEQVKEFIKKFFVQVQDKESGEALLKQLEDTSNRQIKDSVRNPLRLMLLCNSWRQGGKLPNTKAELYGLFVERFYDFKKDKPSEKKQSVLHNALGELAKWALDSSSIRFRIPLTSLPEDPEDLRKTLGYPDSKDSPLWWARKLGWLNNVGVANVNVAAEKSLKQVYAFYHPTFQEYFAAGAIDKWDYFLNHVPHNPQSGAYRIFQPQWKEVMKLWVGREDIPKEEKEQFIKALVEFQDECEHLYSFRGFLVAAEMIAEFRDCSRADEIVAKIVEAGFGCFNIENQKWTTLLPSPFKEGALAILPETDTARAIEALVHLIDSARDEYTRRQAAESLGKIGTGNETAIAALVRLIDSDGNEYTRREAAESLGKIGTGNETAIAALVRLIGSARDAYIRPQAAESLGKIGTGNETAIAALVRLIDSDGDEYTRRQAAEILGKIGNGNETAIDALVRLIHSDVDEYTRRQAAESLGEIGTGNKTAIDALVLLIETTGDKDTRRQAAESLGEIGSGNETAIEALVRLIDTAWYEDTRRQAAESLVKIGSGNKKPAIDALVRLIDSTRHEGALCFAAESLVKIDTGNKKPAIDALVRFIDTTRDNFPHRHAAESLVKIGSDNENAIAALVHLIDFNQDKDTRRQAAESLGKIDTGNKKTAIDALVRLIDSDGDKYTRRHAVESLVKIGTGNENAIAALVRLIDSTRDDSTRDEFTLWLAAESLGKIDTGNKKPAIDALVHLINSTGDEFILCRAAESLGKIDTGKETAIDALLRLIDCRAAESLGKIDTGNETAIDALLRLIHSPRDKSILSQAVVSLGKIGTGDKTAIAALVRLIDFNQDKFIFSQAVESLEKIDSGKETVIAALVRLIDSDGDENTRGQAAESLGKIVEIGNKTAINALARLIDTTQDQNTHMQAAYSLSTIGTGNETAIDALVRLIDSTGDVSISWIAAAALQKILQFEQMARVVTALKDKLCDETYKNNINVYQNYLNVIWHCAQNLPYPDFYQAWHNLQPQTQALKNLVIDFPTQLHPTANTHPIAIDANSLALSTNSQEIAEAFCNQIYDQALPDADIPTANNFALLQREMLKLKRQLQKDNLALILYSGSPHPQLLQFCRALASPSLGLHLAWITDAPLEAPLRGFPPRQPNLVNAINSWIAEL